MSGRVGLRPAVPIGGAHVGTAPLQDPGLGTTSEMTVSIWSGRGFGRSRPALCGGQATATTVHGTKWASKQDPLIELIQRLARGSSRMDHPEGQAMASGRLRCRYFGHRSARWHLSP